MVIFYIAKRQTIHREGQRDQACTSRMKTQWMESQKYQEKKRFPPQRSLETGPFSFSIAQTDVDRTFLSHHLKRKSHGNCKKITCQKGSRQETRS